MVDTKDALKKKSTKLTMLEDKYKRLYKDKRVIDDCLRTIMPNNSYILYTQYEPGMIE